MNMTVKKSTLILVVLLTGCVLSERYEELRYPPTRISIAKKINSEICIPTNIEADYKYDYKLRIIFIYPRGTRPKNHWHSDEPNLPIVEDRICLPEYFFPFHEKVQYVVEMILISNKPPRHGYFESKRISSAFEIENGQLTTVKLDLHEY